MPVNDRIQGWVHEVEDETIGAGVPVLLGIWDGFQWNHGCEQFVPQGGRDQLVRFPDALSRANLESDICQFRYIMLAEESYFYPSLRITQRCISLELLEYVVDLDTKVKASWWRWSEDSKTLPWWESASSRVVAHPLPLAVKLLPSTSQQ